MLFILYWMIRSSRHNHQDRISGGKFPALLFVALLVSLAAYTNGYEGEGGILHSNHLRAKQIATRRVNALFLNNVNVKQGETSYQKTYAEFTKFRKSLSRNNAQDTTTLELLFRHRRQRRGTRELPFEISEGDSGVAGNSFANRFPSPSEGNQAPTSTFPPRDFIREPLLPPVEYPYGPNTNMSGTMDSFNHSSRYNFLSIWNISRPTYLSPPLISEGGAENRQIPEMTNQNEQNQTETFSPSEFSFGSSGNGWSENIGISEGNGDSSTRFPPWAPRTQYPPHFTTLPGYPTTTPVPVTDNDVFTYTPQNSTEPGIPGLSSDTPSTPIPVTSPDITTASATVAASTGAEATPALNENYTTAFHFLEGPTTTTTTTTTTIMPEQSTTKATTNPPTSATTIKRPSTTHEIIVQTSTVPLQTTNRTMTLEYLGIGSTTNISESYNATTEVPFPSHIHTAKNDDVRYNWDRSVDRTRKLALAIAIPVVLLLFVILIAIAWVTVFEVRWNQRRVDVEASGNTNQTGGRTSASSEYSSPEVIHVPKRNGHNTPEAWANGIHQERVVS